VVAVSLKKKTTRRNGPSSRNIRLAAIKSFMHFMEYRVPAAMERIRRILAIPAKKTESRLVRHLTVEEMQARQPVSERAFMDQAVQIVVSEIESLERRVRAFSEFASEPLVRPENLDINAIANERIALLRPVHPSVTYLVRLAQTSPRVHADSDLVNGILTNLLQNAAEAAGPGGTVIVVTRTETPRVLIEVHDSGPGLSEDVSARLFEPTITFKKQGMGLGLSIAKKNALLSGGDIIVIPGEMGGAAFRVSLPS